MYLCHRGQYTTVLANRYVDLAVAQQFLHLFGIDAHAEQNRRSAVPQVVQANRR
jgi:hypothetical protein